MKKILICGFFLNFFYKFLEKSHLQKNDCIIFFDNFSKVSSDPKELSTKVLGNIINKIVREKKGKVGKNNQNLKKIKNSIFHFFSCIYDVQKFLHKSALKQQMLKKFTKS